ncbi:MAG TPA: glycosyltransferase family 4 protein [Steroidobacter sp.]|uniref:glycosyltransferase family 4 protein n=1 Tax=Steroidobacter sp. TaxID=1978227 RepID=UPI002ED8524A
MSTDTNGGIKIAVVLSAVLGNRTISTRLLESLQRLGRTLENEIWLMNEDYRTYRAPGLIRRFSTLETAHVTSRKLADIAGPSPDVVIVNGYELALAAQRRFRDSRLVVALDATPGLVWRLHGQTGEPLLRRTLKYPLAQLQHAQFARFAAKVWHWLPISNFCRDSLTDTYRVQPKACHVMRAPQVAIADMSATVVPARQRRRLLFVGNDFLRKGGDRLLQAMGNQLAATCELTIVSNDATIGSLALPSNARWLRGIQGPEQMGSVYREHDLLVLPTSYDIYPNVLCEALAQATPFLATGLPGIQELIGESNAGWTLPLHASPEQIAAAVMGIDDLAAARPRALAYARENLTTAALDRSLSEILAAASVSSPQPDHPGQALA